MIMPCLEIDMMMVKKKKKSQAFTGVNHLNTKMFPHLFPLHARRDKEKHFPYE